MSRNHKRQRIDVESIPFSQAEPWVVGGDPLNSGDRQTDYFCRMTMDNERGVLYVLISVPSKAHAADYIVRRVQCASAGPQIIKSLVAAIPELAAFPPGVVPVIAAYADTEGEVLGETLIKDPAEITHMEADPTSGQLICFILGEPYLIKVYPNGTMNYIHQLKTLGTPVHFFTYMTVSNGKCISMLHDLFLYELEWKEDNYYIPHRIPHSSIVEGMTQSVVLDDRYIYVMKAMHQIHRVSRNASEDSEGVVIFKSISDLFHPMRWCGTKHILFMMQDDENKSNVSVYILDLNTRQATCLVTQLSIRYVRGDYPFDLCVVHRLARGPCLLIYSNYEFRTVPLPSYVLL